MSLLYGPRPIMAAVRVRSSSRESFISFADIVALNIEITSRVYHTPHHKDFLLTKLIFGVWIHNTNFISKTFCGCIRSGTAADMRAGETCFVGGYAGTTCLRRVDVADTNLRPEAFQGFKMRCFEFFCVLTTNLWHSVGVVFSYSC